MGSGGELRGTRRLDRNSGPKRDGGLAVRESRRDLNGDDRDERHGRARTDQAELAETASRDRAKEWRKSDDVDRGDAAANVLEPRRQVAARAEEERLDGSDAQIELIGDLRVGEALPLAQEDAATLALGKMREPVPQRLEPLAPLVAGRLRRSELVDVFDLLGDGGETPAVNQDSGSSPPPPPPPPPPPIGLPQLPQLPHVPEVPQVPVPSVPDVPKPQVPSVPTPQLPTLP